MAKTRWRHRCSAHRPRDGRPCRAWAITGGKVCVAHGGAAQQVRVAAALNIEHLQLARALASGEARWRKQYREWQVDRLLRAAELLGEDPLKFCRRALRNPSLMTVAALRFPGEIPGEDTAPQPRLDQKYLPTRPSTVVMKRKPARA